jgi:hypothetical protein
MQTNNMIIDNEIDSFSSKGSTDARINQEVNVDIGKIKPAARNAYYKIKAEYAGIIEQTKMKYDHTKAKVSELQTDLTSIKDQLKGFEVMSVLKLVFYYTIPGLLYVAGDVMFSMELMVKGWGLGANSVIEQWTLGIAIGLAPFFVKHLIDRFFEPNLEYGSDQLKRWLTAVYLGLGLLMIFSFCQIAYVRSIFFRFMNTDSGGGNIYDQLFEVYGGAIAASFILVALMFVIGGGFLLSISSRQFAKRKEFKTLTKSQEIKTDALELSLESLGEYKKQQVEIETLYKDWENKDECIEHLENELKYAYKNGFTTELTSSLDSTFNHLSFDKIGEGKDGFHNFTKHLVDQYSMNKKGNSYNA